MQTSFFHHRYPHDQIPKDAARHELLAAPTLSLMIACHFSQHRQDIKQYRQLLPVHLQLSLALTHPLGMKAHLLDQQGPST